MNASPRSKRTQPPVGQAFVALGIVIAEVAEQRLLDLLRPQPDVRLVRIADTAAGGSCYRVEVALPTQHDATEALIVWRHVKDALLENLPADIGPIRIIET